MKAFLVKICESIYSITDLTRVELIIKLKNSVKTKVD